MLKVRTDLLREWKMETGRNGVLFTFPVPEGAKGLIPFGFEFISDSAADWTGWYGLELALAMPEGTGGMERTELLISVAFSGREPLSLSVPILLQNGRTRLEIPFSHFPIERAKENIWKYVVSVRIQCALSGLRITECAAKRCQGIFLHIPNRGKSGEPGERIVYEGAVYNCSARPLLVSAEQVFDGWESLLADISLKIPQKPKENASFPASAGSLLLLPGESAPLAAAVTIHENMVPGGHETTCLRVWGRDDEGSFQDSVSLQTLRRLPHPYLYHSAEGWKAVVGKLTAHDFYSGAWEKYRSAAEGWVVTDPLPGRDFCDETKVEGNVMCTAYV